MKLAIEPGAIIDIHENYVKQTYRNRYDVNGVNGLIRLTVPVQGQKGEKIPFHEILIAGNEWRKNHLSTIKSAYGRAAYFEHYIENLEEIFLGSQATLLELNLDILEWIKASGVKFELKLSQEHVVQNGTDYRRKFEPAQSWPELTPYPQVFSDRFPFKNNMSVLDLLMNKGPQAADYLRQLDLGIFGSV